MAISISVWSWNVGLVVGRTERARVAACTVRMEYSGQKAGRGRRPCHATGANGKESRVALGTARCRAGVRLCTLSQAGWVGVWVSLGGSSGPRG